MIVVASIYSRGFGDFVQKWAIYCGISSSTKIFMKHIKLCSINIEKHVKSILGKESMIVVALGNN